MLKDCIMNKFFTSIVLIFAIALFINAQTYSAPQSLHFPKDHGMHPKTNMEWWNFYGHLMDAQNRLFGFSLTFLRMAVPAQNMSSAWDTKAIYISYFTITDNKNDEFYYQEKMNRTSFHYAGASEDTLQVWNGHWQVTLNKQVISLKAQSDKADLTLRLAPVKPALLYGSNGFFQIEPSTDQNSYYYSFPRLQGDGELTLNGEHYKIISAAASMDHEFQLIQNYDMTWDRFEIQLDNNDEIIIYIINAKNGTFVSPYSFGVINLANGQTIRLQLADFLLTEQGRWQSGISNKSYPSGWQLKIPGYHYQLNIEPTIKKQEIVGLNSTFWLGQARVSGDINGKTIHGQAYVELSKQSNRSYKLF